MGNESTEIERRLTTVEVKLMELEKNLDKEIKTNEQINDKLDKLIMDYAVRNAGLTKYDKVAIYTGMFGSILIAITSILVHL
jgi:hypothetical protein